jgi:hypothetical protein
VTASQRANAKPSGNKTKVVKVARVSDTVSAGQSMGVCFQGSLIVQCGLDYCGKA